MPRGDERCKRSIFGFAQRRRIGAGASKSRESPLTPGRFMELARGGGTRARDILREAERSGAGGSSEPPAQGIGGPGGRGAKCGALFSRGAELSFY